MIVKKLACVAAAALARLAAENAALRADSDALRAGQERLVAELAELRSKEAQKK